MFSENVIYVYSSYSKIIVSTVLGLAGWGSYTGRVANLFHSRIMCYFLATKMLLVSGEVGKGQGVLFWKRGSITWNIVTGIAIFLLLSISKSRTERCVRKTKCEIMTVSLLGNITGGTDGGSSAKLGAYLVCLGRWISDSVWQMHVSLSLYIYTQLIFNMLMMVVVLVTWVHEL